MGNRKIFTLPNNDKLIRFAWAIISLQDVAAPISQEMDERRVLSHLTQWPNLSDSRLGGQAIYNRTHAQHLNPTLSRHQRIQRLHTVLCQIQRRQPNRKRGRETVKVKKTERKRRRERQRESKAEEEEEREL